MIGTRGNVMKTPWRPFWTPAVHVYNLQLSSAGSPLRSCCNLWLSSAWMHPRRSDVWSVIRYGWFTVEMEGLADANWADISAVFTSLQKKKKKHVIIGLREEGFKAPLITKNNWKERDAAIPSEHCRGPIEQGYKFWNAQVACLGQPTHAACDHLYVQSFIWFNFLKKRACSSSFSQSSLQPQLLLELFLFLTSFPHPSGTSSK